MAALGGMFGGGGGGAKNSFGQTQQMSAGRWVDVTLYSRNNPSLAEAQQAVPAGFMSPALKLQAPRDAKPPPPDTGDEPIEHEVEKPRGRLLLYWGCGATVRAGQPKVLDMASATRGRPGEVLPVAPRHAARHAQRRGPAAVAERDRRAHGARQRLAGRRACVQRHRGARGLSLPDPGGAGPDAAPAGEAERPGAAPPRSSWQALPHGTRLLRRRHGRARRTDEMVIWTSSEQPDIGFGLIDYQTNAAVDRWLREKVLLAPATTQCTVPKGVFPGEGAMLRVIAYGSELNLVHPPRPADPKATWEPVWAAKMRVKSVASVMLGMPAMEPMPSATKGGTAPAEAADKPAQQPKPLDLLRGILGR